MEFFLEQIEGLQEKTFEMSLQRIGSWIIDPMPIPIILSTFNPTQNWIKKKVYDPWVKDELKEPWFFMQALPEDNPTVTDDQWEAWKLLDPINYRRFIEGDWNAFAINNPFAYAFDESKHLSPVVFDPTKPLQISFDFNVDPITCIAGQEHNILREFRLKNSDIYELCDRIKATYPNALYIITGDATGHNRSALAKGNINFYTVIKQKLSLSDGQMKQPGTNPAISDSRVLVNSILQNAPVKIDPVNCPFLIQDLKFVEVDEDGEINKTKDKYASHLLDAYRYYLSTFYKSFLRL